MGNNDHLKGHDPAGEEEAAKPKPEPEKKSEERADSRRPVK